MEAAREVAAGKPVLAMKAGRTEQGAKAASSHTGSLAGVDIATELIFEKTGIISFIDEGGYRAGGHGLLKPKFVEK